MRSTVTTTTATRPKQKLRPPALFKLAVVYLQDTTVNPQRRTHKSEGNPMIYYNMENLKSCYAFIEARKLKVGLADIYRKADGAHVARFTQEKDWNNFL